MGLMQFLREMNQAKPVEAKEPAPLMIDELISAINGQINRRKLAENKLSQLRDEQQSLSIEIEKATAAKAQLLEDDVQDITQIGIKVSEQTHIAEAGEARLQRIANKIKETRDSISRLEIEYMETVRLPLGNLPGYRHMKRAQAIATSCGQVLEVDSMNIGELVKVRQAIWNLVHVDRSLRAPAFTSAEHCLSYLETHREEIQASHEKHQNLTVEYAGKTDAQILIHRASTNTDTPWMNLDFGPLSPKSVVGPGTI